MTRVPFSSSGGVRRNVWLGTSVSDQRTVEWAERLVAAPDVAALKFVSVEPMVGPIRLPASVLRAIRWLIIGGETGSGARPLEIAWVRELIEQCKAAGIAVFVKQLGCRPTLNGERLRLRSWQGKDQAEWPDGLCIREFPKGGAE